MVPRKLKQLCYSLLISSNWCTYRVWRTQFLVIIYMYMYYSNMYILWNHLNFHEMPIFSYAFVGCKFMDSKSLWCIKNMFHNLIVEDVSTWSRVNYWINLTNIEPSQTLMIPQYFVSLSSQRHKVHTVQ